MLMNSQPTKRCFLSYADRRTDKQGDLAAGEDSSVNFMQQQQWWRRDTTNKQWFFFLSLSLSSCRHTHTDIQTEKELLQQSDTLSVDFKQQQQQQWWWRRDPTQQTVDFLFSFFFFSLVQTEEDTDGAFAARVCLSPSFCWFQCNNYGGCRPNKQFPPKHSFL